MEANEAVKKGRFTVLDLFCGTGALSYGLEAHGSVLQTVGGIDFNAAAAQTARLNHPAAHIVCDSIEQISPDYLLSQTGLSAIDLIVGGPPCQGFSSLRPSRGLDLEDPRNALYKQFLKYVQVLRPRIFLMENVVGLLAANQGQLVSQIVASFKRAGYECDWKVLNAANFGVPQKRERFFLLGVRGNRGGSVRPRFPLPTHRFSGKVIGTSKKERYVLNTQHGLDPVTVWDAISDLPSLKSGESKQTYRGEPQNEYQRARRRGAQAVLSLHEAASHNAKMLEVIRHAGSSINALPEGLVSSGYSSCYSRISADEPSTTITVKFTSPASSKCIHPFDDRAITPREAARIQGYDDHFQFFGSKTEIASQIGNAVPPLFGKAFAPVLEQLLYEQSIGEH
ncbi:DNA (cytosine-5)-methyltransferase 1 [Inhella inkyongensis]|uniref:Cytosine-specific methyltransferase n=1 Tax=Inhella inkyongensis TaxID=392593 RepID=A0A840RY15_9BURK|nr:DNA cytosine methyltransferase [Inhella inkyongensis]MBB5202835.1 DNA (cytosine-5)-methyltransferase 1 [Inhella inkyongensis]